MSTVVRNNIKEKAVGSIIYLFEGSKHAVDYSLLRRQTRKLRRDISQVPFDCTWLWNLEIAMFEEWNSAFWAILSFADTRQIGSFLDRKTTGGSDETIIWLSRVILPSMQIIRSAAVRACGIYFTGTVLPGPPSANNTKQAWTKHCLLSVLQTNQH